MSRLANKQCEAYVSLCLALSPYDRQVYSGLLDVSVIAGKEVCIYLPAQTQLTSC